REWASKRTMLAAGMRGGMGGACRQAYGHEWSRLMVLLQAMQGLGKPGVNIWGATMGAPIDAYLKFPGFEQGGIMLVGDKTPVNPTKQHIYRTLFPDSILNPPTQWLSPGWCTKSIEQQFIPYIYPEKNNPEVRMLYRYGGSYIGTMTEGNKWINAFRSPKLECIVNQDCWWCNETGFADIILPACTNLERNDIAEFSNCGYMSPDTMSSCNHRIAVYQQKCIEPVGESKSDYRIFTDLAVRIGIGEEYTEGRSEEDWIRRIFDWSDLPKYISYEEFKTKGYFLVPLPEPYKSTPALRWFYEGRECDTPDFNNPKRGTEKAKELATYSGKIEFVSQSLKTHLPDDDVRPPMPRYIPSWEGHTSELARKYPLQLISPHPIISHHTHYDHIPWIWDIPHQRIFKDGYYWQTVRIHPLDAGARGIKDRDIVKLYNDRGAVLGIAYVTERMRPGVVHSYEASAKYSPVVPGKSYSADRGGCVNILTPSRMMSKNAPGFAPNACLVEVSRWEA
ncbi:MAG: molybdopterin-dependent oxidoreductase, partial [Desulfobacteraceae bacterium]|nr:molybdopterin-dependent oxidoreductase [Desulfobacteraceae bacterium]